MSATIGAAAITAGAGLLGSFFGSHKQDKNSQDQRDWQEKMYLMDREYNTASNQRKRFEEAGLNPNLQMEHFFIKPLLQLISQLGSMYMGLDQIPIHLF